MGRKYLPPSTAKAKGINVPAPDALEPVTEQIVREVTEQVTDEVATQVAQLEQGDQAPVPAESETRDTLEAYAVEHAGLTEEEAKAFPNKGELHAAIVAAVEKSES